MLFAAPATQTMVRADATLRLWHHYRRSWTPVPGSEPLILWAGDIMARIWTNWGGVRRTHLLSWRLASAKGSGGSKAAATSTWR